jgi:type II secretory ATPase GspE/PulE/Tfp pilus assembly ATPase PilB-like protein
VIAQRLVRTICKHCHTYGPITDEWAAKLRKVGLDPVQMGGRVAFGKGCDECFNSGYAGRTAIYEFMPVDEALRTQIMNNATAAQMKRGAVERGMITQDHGRPDDAGRSIARDATRPRLNDAGSPACRSTNTRPTHPVEQSSPG